MVKLPFRVFKPRISTREQRDIIAHVDKSLEIRNETLSGREYIVVPVVAMVEGVRFGANQNSPELGLASDFGENPILWANRPLVLNHPQLDGVFVSANSPQILEDYAFGITMNPYVEDGKLKLEAWIDVAVVEAKGGEFEEILESITEDNDIVVEISVGFFSDVEQKSGKFKGQSYSGVWRNIRPDHLAILSKGTRGACSVEDGCGIPRINKEKVMPNKQEPKPNGLKTDSQGCGCGGEGNTCTCNEHNHSDVESSTIDTLEAKPSPRGSVPSVKPNAAREDRTAIRAHLQQLIDQQIDPSLTDSDVRKLIGQAFRTRYPAADSYLYGFTQDFAIFETYDYPMGYRMYKIGINVSEDKVEFVGEPSDVVLLTRLVDQENKPILQTNNEPVETKTPIDLNQETNMANDNVIAETKNPTTQEAPKPQETPKPLTAQEYIAQAPEELRDVLSSSLRMHSEKKTGLIKTLTDYEHNKFSEDYLKTQTIDVLENMVGLLPPSFKGVAPATQPTTQSADNFAPEPPRLGVVQGSKKDQAA